MTQQTTELLLRQMRRGKSAAAHRIDRLILLGLTFFSAWLLLCRLSGSTVFSVILSALLSVAIASLLRLLEERRKETYLDRRIEQAREACRSESVCFLSEDRIRLLLPEGYGREDISVLRCAWDEAPDKNDILRLEQRQGVLVITAACSPAVRRFSERAGFSSVLDLNELDLSRLPRPTDKEVSDYITAANAAKVKNGQTIRARFFVRARWKQYLFSAGFLLFSSFFSPIAMWYRLLSAVCFALFIASLFAEKEG